MTDIFAIPGVPTEWLPYVYLLLTYATGGIVYALTAIAKRLGRGVIEGRVTRWVSFTLSCALSVGLTLWSAHAAHQSGSVWATLALAVMGFLKANGMAFGQRDAAAAGQPTTGSVGDDPSRLPGFTPAPGGLEDIP